MTQSKRSEWRWSCVNNGCYLEKVCLDFYVFDDCFPGNIRMSDVDGFVEINHSFLMLEWKHNDQLPRGQEIAFQRFSKIEGDIVFVVQGNAETMEVYEFGVFFNDSPNLIRIRGDIDVLREVIKIWVGCAKSNDWGLIESRLGLA